jgi:hypothetical protein
MWPSQKSSRWYFSTIEPAGAVGQAGGRKKLLLATVVRFGEREPQKLAKEAGGAGRAGNFTNSPVQKNALDHDIQARGNDSFF